MGCTASTAAGDAPSDAGNDAEQPPETARDASDRLEANRRGSDPTHHKRSSVRSRGDVTLSVDTTSTGMDSVAWGSLGSCTHGGALPFQISVQVDVDRPGSQRALRDTAVAAVASLPVTPPAAPPRKQFKWIADTMWEQGSVCGSCGSATPTACVDACRTPRANAGAVSASGTGAGGAGSASPASWAATAASPMSDASIQSPRRTPRGALGARSFRAAGPCSPGGRAIAQYRLGQAMAAMRLRRGGSPAHTLGPSRGYQTPTHRPSPLGAVEAPPPALAHVLFRSQSTSSGEWDMSACEGDTPVSGSTDVSMSSSLSFYTFSALLGYPHHCRSPTQSERRWPQRTDDAGSDEARSCGLEAMSAFTGSNRTVA